MYAPLPSNASALTFEKLPRFEVFGVREMARLKVRVYGSVSDCACVWTRPVVQGENPRMEEGADAVMYTA